MLYGCILGAIFVVIPFTYFFYEEFGENVSFCRRVFAGCKYTIFLVLAAVIILVIGLFVQGGSPSTEDKDYKKYVEKIIDTENRTAAAPPPPPPPQPSSSLGQSSSTHSVLLFFFFIITFFIFVFFIIADVCV